MDRARPLNRAIDDDCPVPDQMLGAIHRATPAEALSLARLLPEGQRARLALFCYARNHLREAGLAIAVACADGDLVRYGGVSGQALIVQRRLPAAEPSFRTRPRVTLSTRASQHLFVNTTPDDETDEDAA